MNDSDRSAAPPSLARSVALGVLVLFGGFQVVSWLAGGRGRTGPAPGTRVAAVALPALGGGEALAGSSGTPATVLEFWATWCGPCQRSLPTLHTLARRYSDRAVRFVAVNVDEASEDRLADVSDMAAALGLAGLQIALDDGRAARAYRVSRLPLVVVLAADGRVVESWTGALSEGGLTSSVDALLAGAQAQKR